jgi:hypothetical protein
LDVFERDGGMSKVAARLILICMDEFIVYANLEEAGTGMEMLPG